MMSSAMDNQVLFGPEVFHRRSIDYDLEPEIMHKEAGSNFLFEKIEA